jgi:hypothetical protein
VYKRVLVSLKTHQFHNSVITINFYSMKFITLLLVATAICASKAESLIQMNCVWPGPNTIHVRLEKSDVQNILNAYNMGGGNSYYFGSHVLNMLKGFQKADFSCALGRMTIEDYIQATNMFTGGAAEFIHQALQLIASGAFHLDVN